MIKRIYVEKRQGFDVAAANLAKEIRNLLNIPGVECARIILRYDVEGISAEDFEYARSRVFSEPNADITYSSMPETSPGSRVLFTMFLPGQYDQRADSAAQCLQLISGGQRPAVAAATIYIFEGSMTDDEFARVKRHLINPVESCETDDVLPATLQLDLAAPQDVEIIHGFITMSDERLKKTAGEMAMAMSAEDLIFCRNFFRDDARRDPTITELRVIDTYWSDHCRHTTFLTRLESIAVEDGRFSGRIKNALRDYMNARTALYGDRERDRSLMDMATLPAKLMARRGQIPDLDVSEEINACSIQVDANINGETEKWLVMFKNETHNHPTEIEPFGGAATCLGGAIRDPLSGRSYVYQSMRITGAADPRTPFEDTIPGKLPQRTITKTAADGFSAYGNQIGLAAGHICEIYHPGYAAKRLEAGAVIGAAPKDNVRRASPQPGDIVVLLGGRTGRDGCGGATGSSKAHTAQSIIDCSAEVQKGNPPTERSIQRLFRNPELTHMIIRCNDFGAGGVSVAIGELAPGLLIDLDAVPKKYEGLDGTELAISESQERMACVIAEKDFSRFEQLARAENLEATRVATVTARPAMHMTWRGKTIVDLPRKFLDTNGVTQTADALIKDPGLYAQSQPAGGTLREKLFNALGDLNVCSQKGLVEQFDGSIGAGSVISPFGGKTRQTPNQAMVSALPVAGARTATAMAHGYDPYLSSWSPFHGAAYAVIEALSKLAACGANVENARMSFQEYFRRMTNDPATWGLPAAALLGAVEAQLRLNIPSIGGKDSMSGTFEDIHVPPALIAFAVSTLETHEAITPELKSPEHTLAFLPAPRDGDMLPKYETILQQWRELKCAMNAGNIAAAYTVGRGGIAAAIAKMAFGNRIGVRLDISSDELFEFNTGGMVLELNSNAEAPLGARIIGRTTKEQMIKACGEEISLSDAANVWMQPLEGVFPTRAQQDGDAPALLPFSQRSQTIASSSFARPRVFIPVFYGTNTEYDIERAFAAAGAEVASGVFVNLTAQDIEQSVAALEEGISSCQILIFPGGFSAGDEPGGSGKFIAAAIRNPRIAQAITRLLTQRDGLILGICNGFQALIKTGLLPYGEIRELNPGDPTLTYNAIGRHMACISRTVVTSVHSPWMLNSNVGDVHQVAMSHGEGRFVCSQPQLSELHANGQIASRYCDDNGVPSMDITINPNGSAWAVEGLFSPDGRIFGKMGHNERMGEHLLKNIPGKHDSGIFASGVEYFK